MGYSGTAEGLLDPDTNMTYAVKYLARAYRAAKCNSDRAISYYQRGFYGTALAKCAGPQPVVMQVAKIETNALARPGGDAAPIQTADVMQPRVVHIETFTKSKLAPTVAVKPAKFEPVRVAPAQENPVVAAAADPAQAGGAGMEAPAVVTAELVFLPMPRSRPARAPRAVALAGVEADMVIAKLEPEAVPLPPVRPDAVPAQSETTAAARHKSKWVRHWRHRHGPRSAKADKPVGLIALLQKLTTPDKKPRRHRAR
jgi:hypothetical protein